jgi:hypothetical protein
MFQTIVEKIITHFIFNILPPPENPTFYEIKVKQSRYRPGVAQRVPGSRGSQISRQSPHEGGKIASPTHRPP